MAFRLNRWVRLNRAEDYRLAFRSGFQLKYAGVIVYYCDNRLPFARIGVVVPKRVVKHATYRHRLKRIIRESFRLNQFQLKGDVVVRVVSVSSYDEKWLWQSLNQAWQQCGKGVVGYSAWA